MIKVLKKIYLYFILPLGLFFLSAIFQKDNTESKKEIKEKKKDLKIDNALVKTQEKIVEEASEEFDEKVEAIEKVVEENLAKKEDRDATSAAYFPELK